MLHVFISNSISIRSNLSIHYYSAKSFILVFLLLSLIPRCLSASISTDNNLSSASADQSDYMVQLSKQNFILRQYFIDLLNISHSSLVRSMLFDHHFTKNKTVSKNLGRRKRSITDSLSFSPIFTLQSSNCSAFDHKIHTRFQWSYSLTSLASIEFIYQIDSSSIEHLSQIPIHLRWRRSNDFIEWFDVQTQIEFDADRNFYFLDILPHFPRVSTENFTIEVIFPGETCLTSQIYMIVSSLTKDQFQIEPEKSSSSINLRQLVETKATTSSSSACQLQSIQIKFEELGLAYLIIRPKEYLFTYCSGSCSSPSSFRSQSSSGSSMHALLQMMIQRNNPHLPQPTCVPSEYADDHFLLRQNDGTIEISPIKNIIVKQCACL